MHIHIFALTQTHAYKTKLKKYLIIFIRWENAMKKNWSQTGEKIRSALTRFVTFILFAKVTSKQRHLSFPKMLHLSSWKECSRQSEYYVDNLPCALRCNITGGHIWDWWSLPSRLAGRHSSDQLEGPRVHACPYSMTPLITAIKRSLACTPNRLTIQDMIKIFASDKVQGVDYSPCLHVTSCRSWRLNPA